MGRYGQLMAGWGWMSRLAGDARPSAGGSDGAAYLWLPSRGGLRESGLAKSKVPEGARGKGPILRHIHGSHSHMWLVGATGNLPSFKER